MKAVIIMKLRLKEIREVKGITQFELSQMMNVAPSTVGLWEQGRREPSYEKLCRLAEIFNVSTDYLLGRENSSKERRDLINNYESLTTDGRNIILEILNSLKVTHSAESV